MSILARLKEFIGRHHRPAGPDESPPAEVSVEFWIERQRRMTPQERAETLRAEHDQWKAEKKEDLKYQTSLVDLMKLTGQDFSLEHRRELAAELGWPGDPADTAAMNESLYPIVLHRLQIVY